MRRRIESAHLTSAVEEEWQAVALSSRIGVVNKSPAQLIPRDRGRNHIFVWEREREQKRDMQNKSKKGTAYLLCGWHKYRNCGLVWVQREGSTNQVIALFVQQRGEGAFNNGRACSRAVEAGGRLIKEQLLCSIVERWRPGTACWHLKPCDHKHYRSGDVEEMRRFGLNDT